MSEPCINNYNLIDENRIEDLHTEKKSKKPAYFESMRIKKSVYWNENSILN